jgi:hypothetical protein
MAPSGTEEAITERIIVLPLRQVTFLSGPLVCGLRIPSSIRQVSGLLPTGSSTGLGARSEGNDSAQWCVQLGTVEVERRVLESQ